MSLILDALKRSDAEKKQTFPVSMMDDPSIERDRSSTKKFAVVAGLATVALILLGFWWMEPGATTVNVHSSAARVEDRQARQRAAVEGPVLRSDPEAGSEQVAAPERSQLSVAQMSVAPSNGAARRPPSLDSAELAALNRAMWEDAGVSGQGKDEEATTNRAAIAIEPSAQNPAIDLQEVMERLAMEAGDPALSLHSTPLLENLTQQQKDRVPTIIYSAHQFSGEDMAFVELNGSRLRAGESSDAIRVNEILADSVILTVAGTQFRLKALNSWVNL